MVCKTNIFTFLFAYVEEEAAPAPALPNIVPQVPVPAQGLGAAHQALLQGGGPTGFQPYKKPEMFGVKVSSVFDQVSAWDVMFYDEHKNTH